MKWLIIFNSFVGVFFFQNCQENYIDQVIERIDNTDISELVGVSIYLRSRSVSNESIYFINSYRGKCSPYKVTILGAKDENIEVNNDLVLRSCQQDYFTKKQVIDYMSTFLKLKINLLFIDDNNNVYINPNKEDKPILLRLSGNNQPTDLNQYKQYKGNWYIRKDIE